MAPESRTRFAWMWAGILAGVVLGGASVGAWREPAKPPPPEAEARGAASEESARLAQVDPNAPGVSPAPGTQSTPGVSPAPGTQSTPGVSPTPGTTPGTTPGVGGSDAGVGGSGYAPPSTSYTGQDGGIGTPSPVLTPDAGMGGSGTTPPVGGFDGGLGF